MAKVPATAIAITFCAVLNYTCFVFKVLRTPTGTS
jgi:hypothetical protein